MRTSSKSIVYIGVLLAGIMSILAGCSGSGGSAQAASKGGGGRGRGGDAGPVPVTVATVSQKDVPIDIQVIGNVEAYATITIKAQVSGQVTDVAFQEGNFVKKNQRLFTIDPRPYEAQISQIEANIERDKAVLKQSQANLQRDTAQQKYAEDQANRYAKLYEEKVMSKEQAERTYARPSTARPATSWSSRATWCRRTPRI
jgi:multidrug efflux system membrane fusion protein